MKRASLFALAAVLLTMVGLPACTSGIGAAAPRAMNRPVRVALACFDLTISTSPAVRPLADCALQVDVSTNTRTTPVNTALHMHALVTQETRGEVGAVDLIARTVLDSDQSLPGYTFVPVGELPNDIVVPPTDPTCTYVASRGPVDGLHPGITILDTRRFRAGGSGGNRYPSYPAYRLPAAPSQMELAPDGGSLWIALDAIGVLVRVPIVASCQLGAIDLVVPLSEDVPDGVAPVAGASADTVRTCQLTPDQLSPVVVPAPRDPAVDPNATIPEPVAFAFDEDNGLILVADRAFPLIHRVRIADGTLDTPLATGAPVRDVVVTPRVPDDYDLVDDPQAGNGCTTYHGRASRVPDPTTTFSRYVYAIDDTDGSVMAIEYTSGNPSFGAVLGVDVEASVRPDRIPMSAIARSLEILTPSYDVTAADPRIAPAADAACQRFNPRGYGLCVPSDPSPTQPPSPTVLRGVFLAASMADGTVRLVDVYDLDAPCRGRAFGDPENTGTDCSAPTVTGDTAVYVRRHHPRVGQLLSEFVNLDSGPSVFFSSGSSQSLAEDGTPRTTTTLDAGVEATGTPYLAPLDPPTCPQGMGRVWGAADAPVVCAIIDPFAATAETWSAVYQGTIPGTLTQSANPVFVGGAFTGEIRTRVDYCVRGSIGSEEAAAVAAAHPDVPEASYLGDLMAITTTMPADQVSDRALCRAVLGISQVGETQLPVLVRVQHVGTPDDIETPFLGRITVDPTTLIENRATAYPTLRACPTEMGQTCASTDPAHPTSFCDTASNTCMAFPTIADALTCYGDTLLTIDMRSYRSFTVSGTRSGFLNRVVRGADGNCTFDVDPSHLSPLLQGHAFNDVEYVNPRIRFRPTGVPAPTPLLDRSEIRLPLSGAPAQGGVDLSSTSGTRTLSLPGSLLYSDEMAALYVIESQRRGLVEMTLRPLTVTPVNYQ
ncbi:MAG: hypothetical protein U0234_02905 [Sandaracinus sp.]